MSTIFVAEGAISPVDSSVAFVVIADDYRVHVEATEYLAWLRSVGRSPNTERAYAGRIARFLTYCAANRLDWQSVSIRDLRRFLRSLVDDPARRPGLRLATNPPALRLRSNKTANAIFTAVCEFLRFGATRGWVPAALAEDLHYPKFLRYGPPGHDWGENQQFRNVRARTMRLREYDRPPELLTVDEIDSVMRAMQNGRDKLLAILLLESGVRIGEALGLRREDMHLLASSVALGCSTRGPHLHVRRRVNANGALAKSTYPRQIPVTSGLVDSYAQYQHERAGALEEDGSDFVFVNLYKAPFAEPLKYQNAKKMFDRVSATVGFSVRPHMFRHTAATRWLEAGNPRDVVQALLGHVSPASMEVYLHPSDAAKRKAVEQLGRADEE